MTNSPDEHISLDDLEQQWLVLSEQILHPQEILKPLNSSVCLRDFRKSIFELEKYNRSKRQISVDKVSYKSYSQEEILALWEELLKRPDLQTNTNVLRILVKETLYKGIQFIFANYRFIQLITANPEHFFTPLWLRRYYFFFFNTVYLSDEYTLTKPWANVLGACYDHLKFEGSLYRSGNIKVRYIPLVKTLELTTVESEGLKLELFEDYMNTLLQLAPQKALENIAVLEQYYRQSLGFEILPNGIRLYCQKHLFNIYLFKYLNDVNDVSLLSNLLEQFCTLDSSIGQEHLVCLITEAYGGPGSLKKLAQPIRNCIQGFLLRTIKDPRLNNTAWSSLKARNKPIYDGLRYWFVEADFDLFFEFAFRHSRDDHRRKELWGKFLKQAHDFRVFLPSNSHRELQAQLKDENRHAQVYTNYDNITGFIMCIENLVIYEAVETGNAAYIYDLAELESKSSHDASTVLSCISHLLEKNSLPGYMGTRSALAHTYLAPRPDEWDGRTKSRRFTHDRNLFWHDQVLEYLKRYYLIVPDRPD